MRALRIFAIGLVALALLFLFPPYARYLASGIALSPLLLLIAGQLYLPRSKQSIQVWLDPDVAAEHGEVALSLSGRTVTYTYFKRWYEFAIVPRHFILLAGIGIASFGAATVAWFARDVLIEHAIAIRFLVEVWIFLLYLSWRWFWERRVLRQEGISVGPFTVSSGSRILFKDIQYDFVDHKGDRYGGSVNSLFSDATDDLTVIFYDENNPDKSVPASAMIFHKLTWQPGREESEPVSATSPNS